MNLDKIKILLVEDNNIDQRLFKELLRETDIDTRGPDYL